jgi:hypothetical protein
MAAAMELLTMLDQTELEAVVVVAGLELQLLPMWAAMVAQLM